MQGNIIMIRSQKQTLYQKKNTRKKKYMEIKNSIVNNETCGIPDHFEDWHK